MRSVINFVDDLGNYGLRVALFNLRFNIAWAIAKLLIRKPIKMTVKK